MGYRFVPEFNHTRAYMKVILVNFFFFLMLSDLQDHDSLRSRNFATILDCKAIVFFFFFFHNIGFARREAPSKRVGLISP